MKPKHPTILLTGAHGFVGSRIAASLPTIAAPSLRGATQDDVRRMIDEIQPEYIIHTAAISDIPACEADPEASYHANVLVPVYLARAAQGAKLVAFSSDQVYGGCKGEGPFAENDTVPTNTYARHKLEMEQRVLDIAPDAVLLRATWMYDMPAYGCSNRSNFIINMLRAAATQTPIAFSRGQYRGITYVREVARLMEAALRLLGGAYNFGSENTLSMYDTARLFAEELRLAISLSDAPPRSNLWMDCSKLREQGISFSSTIDGLRRCCADYGLL